MSDQIQNNVVKIGSVEDTTTQVKLRDESKKSLGSFFKAKKDGNPTQAWQQFQDMELKSGSIVSIGFKEVPYKDGTIKNIIGFREANALPAKPQAKQAKAPEPTYRKEEPQGEEFWNKKAYKQCLWAYFLHKGKPLLQADADLVWKEFSQIEKEADHRFAHGMERARLALAPDDAPLPDEPGTVSAEDVPF